MATPLFWGFAGVLTALKILLIPSYRSTDFEVHRNWLAVTHSLPMNKWYYEKTSEWTLDYPPFFAWFEFILSHFAKFFDPQMLIVKNLHYSSFGTVLFQRLSVILTDFIFIFAVKEYCEKRLKSVKVWHGGHLLTNPAVVLAVLMMGNFGLLLVDHIHFQYNGFLFGLMLISIVRVCEGRMLEGALWFTTLLNFKHIFLYIAPAYFIYMLKVYCVSALYQDGRPVSTNILHMVSRLFRLGVIVISVFGLSFGPFVYMRQLPQVSERLFPFKRGLTHAYWAPNFWALYNAADKVLLFLGTKSGLLDKSVTLSAWMTGGLVKEFDHAILPSISPMTTLVLTIISLLPSLVHLWLYPNGGKSFIRSVTLCAFSSFMFGWHVHEKAIIIVIIPLCLLAMERKTNASLFLFLSTTGHLSLFPLIHTQAETVIKVCLMLTYTIYAFISLGGLFRSHVRNCHLPLLNIQESAYIIGLAFVEMYGFLIHPVVGLHSKYPFVPLMLMSVYCACGVSYAWIKLYYQTLTDRSGKITFESKENVREITTQSKEQAIPKEVVEQKEPSSGTRKRRKQRGK